MRAHLTSLARRFAWLKRFSADRAGIAAVEFALGGTILFGLSIGILEVGRYMLTVNSLENAAKEGARYAAVHSPGSVSPKTNAQLETYIKDNAIGLDPAALVLDITWQDPVTFAPGTSITIQVDQPFNFFFKGMFTTAPVTLTAQSVFTVGR